MQQPQALACHFLGESIDAGRIAAGPAEICNKAKPDRIFGNSERDRDGRCRRLRGKRCDDAAWRRDDRHLSFDEISHHRRQMIGAALQPVILDRNVFAFDQAGFAKTLAECVRTALEALCRTGVDEANDRQCRLLGAQRKRPCGSSRRATEV